MGVIIKGTDDSIKAADGSLSIEGFSIKTTGIGTFDGGIQVGSAATIHSNGNLGLTGILTATNFKTGTSNVHNTGYNVGTAVTIDGNTGNVALSGIITAASFSGVTATTINNNADNRLITGSGTADTLNGESALTFDGNDLTHTITSTGGQTLTSTGNHAIRITANTDRSAENNTLLALRAQWNDTQVAMIDFQAGDDTTNKDNSKIAFYTAPAGTQEQHMLIESNGNVKINDGNLVMATAGKGIDFSANTSTTTTGAAMTSELLDWYEEGTFEPKITFGNTSDFTGGSYGTCEGTYTRVGRMVTISFTTSISAKGTSSGLVHINGLPFTSGGQTFRGGGRTAYATLFSTESDNVDCQLYLGDTRTYLQCVHDSLDNLNASDCNASGQINTTMQYQVP